MNFKSCVQSREKKTKAWPLKPIVLFSLNNIFFGSYCPNYFSLWFTFRRTREEGHLTSSCRSSIR